VPIQPKQLLSACCGSVNRPNQRSFHRIDDDWPYGAPEWFPTGDVNKDGVTDTADEDAIRDAINNNDYYASADLDYDGDVDSADKTIAQNNNGATLGRGALSDVGNRFGYTGHEYENALGDSAPLWHARDTVMNSAIGRRLQRIGVELSLDYNFYAYAPTNGAIAGAGGPCGNCEKAKDNVLPRDPIYKRIKGWIKAKVTLHPPATAGLGNGGR